MVKFAVRLLWLVPVLWTGVALSQSDETDLQAQAKLDEAQTAAVSEPNYEVLDRMRNFRGPYTNLDDPVRALERKREIERVGVDMSAPPVSPQAATWARAASSLSWATQTTSIKAETHQSQERCRVAFIQTRR